LEAREHASGTNSNKMRNHNSEDHKFASSLIISPKIKSISPLRIKQHDMQTRQLENYIVQNANPEIHKKSLIVYMQNLLKG
jgi:hypothetical protein